MGTVAAICHCQDRIKVALTGLQKNYLYIYLFCFVLFSFFGRGYVSGWVCFGSTKEQNVLLKYWWAFLAKTLLYNNYWELLGCFKDRHPAPALTWLCIGLTCWTWPHFVFLRRFWWLQSCLCSRNMYCISLKQWPCSFGHYTTLRYLNSSPRMGIDRYETCEFSFRTN